VERDGYSILLPSLLVDLATRRLVAEETLDLVRYSRAASDHCDATYMISSRHTLSYTHHQSLLDLQVIEKISVMLNRTTFPSIDHIICLCLFYEQIDRAAMGRYNHIIRRAAVSHARKLLRTTIDVVNGPQCGLLLISHVILTRTLTSAGQDFARSHTVLISNLIERVERLLGQSGLDLVTVLKAYYLSTENVRLLLTAWQSAKGIA
jgi:hypothetical protein